MSESEFKSQPQPQPQPVPQPQPEPQEHPAFQVPATIPAIQNVGQYLAIGRGPDGSPQLYSYDLNLGRWGVATNSAMEQIMVASGVNPDLIRQLKMALPGYLGS